VDAEEKEIVTTGTTKDSVLITGMEKVNTGLM